MSHPAIEFRNVDIVFGKGADRALPMLDAQATRDEILRATGSVVGAADVNLIVEPGEICVLMGLSGSGKSTVLRCVNGLNKVSRGRVLVSHQNSQVDVASCADATLRDLRMHGVSMVFQQFALLPWRTVRQNVGLGLELQGLSAAECRRTVDEKLALVGLTQWADRYANELSGGMQQRVGLARAFATNADILLMDEPFSALDPLIRARLQDELLELQRQLRKTILFVSHDLDEAMKLGNRIAIMQEGRVVQNGTAEDILLRPATPYVAEFVQHTNPLNVLPASAIMRPVQAIAREGAELVLDGKSDIRLGMDELGRMATVRIDGRNGSFGPLEASGSRPDIAVASETSTLRSMIEAKRQSAHPIVLTDASGQISGLCGDDEIYAALLRRSNTSTES
ncbi:choline ABC transporter ATP-binding protein [Aureimonas sp. ME7]|uniref:choline ABC transporter ATP-binding protein n=1 Tax=Aureimonas sp. ME7 TaxID=2744252 RepID=UPI0015F773D4|nr:choline ABC transporter ATP-binding protein [Aureimonas sp. ME7]